MKKCKVCGDKTDVVFNIDFEATPICEGCATAIFLQQAQWYAKTDIKKETKDYFCPNSPDNKHSYMMSADPYSDLKPPTIITMCTNCNETFGK